MRGYSAIELYQPKIGHNIGGVIRAGYCYGASLVIISGCRYSHQITDTMKASRHLPVISVKNPLEAIPYDCVPVAVEKREGAIPLWYYRHPERALYLFGPEDGSISDEVTKKCRDTVFIPMELCMNLAATVNVVLYDRMAKTQSRLPC